jgi:hypothetical protein
VAASPRPWRLIRARSGFPTLVASYPRSWRLPHARGGSPALLTVCPRRRQRGLPIASKTVSASPFLAASFRWERRLPAGPSPASHQPWRLFRQPRPVFRGHCWTFRYLRRETGRPSDPPASSGREPANSGGTVADPGEPLAEAGRTSAQPGGRPAAPAGGWLHPAHPPPTFAEHRPLPAEPREIALSCRFTAGRSRGMATVRRDFLAGRSRLQAGSIIIYPCTRRRIAGGIG